jgi:hypothetical protein
MEDLMNEGSEMASDSEIKPPPSPPILVLVVSDGNEEFPVPFARFSVTLHRTEDEVWLTLMRVEHGTENHKISEWVSMLDKYRGQPAHLEHPSFPS